RRVRRRYIDHKIIGKRRGAAHRLGIIGRGIGAVAVLADIDADNAGLAPARAHALHDQVEPAAVETHAIDQRAVGFESKHTWYRVAGLWPRRHRADLDKAKAES